MARARDPRQVVAEAKQIARDHGLLVAEKSVPGGLRWLLYRIQGTRNVFLGSRGSPEGIRTLVCQVANFH